MENNTSISLKKIHNICRINKNGIKLNFKYSVKRILLILNMLNSINSKCKSITKLNNNMESKI